MKTQIKVTYNVNATHQNLKAYIACGIGCMVPNTDWQEFSGTCYLEEEILSYGHSAIAEVTMVEFMLISTTDEADGVATLYHDSIKIRPYEHRRYEWIYAANKRIEEYRTTPVSFHIQNCPGQSSNKKFEQKV